VHARAEGQARVQINGLLHSLLSTPSSLSPPAARCLSLQVTEDSSCKFHVRPLDDVIAFEKSEGLVQPVPAQFWDSLAQQ
jgi:hypothetical protein